MYSLHKFGIQSSCFSAAKGVEQEKKIQQSCNSNVVIFSCFCLGTLISLVGYAWNRSCTSQKYAWVFFIYVMVVFARRVFW